MTPLLRFLDPCAPRAYADPEDLSGLGGTEATLLRIAAGLAQDGRIVVEQAARRRPEWWAGVEFRPMDLRETAGDTIVVINSWKVALAVARRNPRAQIYVWQHVIPGRHHRVGAADLAAAGIGLLCVSHSLRRIIAGMVETPPPLCVVHNPVCDTLHPDTTARDPDRLLFASAPHKGLDQVLAAFAALRARIPSLRLEIADPGYLVWPVGDVPAGATRLGTLRPADVVARMRSALCLFYPQTRFAETFGLVIAEANAVGTPALVHRGLGANDEVASDASQCIDGGDPDMIAARIQSWRAAPPAVRMRPEFRLSHVLAAWRQLLTPQTSGLGLNACLA